MYHVFLVNLHYCTNSFSQDPLFINENETRNTRVRRPRTFFGDSQPTISRRPIRSRIRNIPIVNDDQNDNHINDVIEIPIQQEIQLELPLHDFIHINDVINNDAPLLTPNDDNTDVPAIIEQLGLNMAEQIIELHNALHLAASGIQPNIPLHMQPAMLNTMNSFIHGIYEKCKIKCTICMQRWFLDKCDGVNLNYVCATCVEEMKISDRNNDVNFVASMSAANSYSCTLQFMMNLVTVSISTQ